MAVTNRKFKEPDFYDTRTEPEYYLLPFRFHRLNAAKEVIVNEVGDHLVVPAGTVERVVGRKIDKYLEEELYGDLIANFFISERSFRR